MGDLVDKFYTGDLSLAEEESLDALLATSPEAADRFEKKAAEAYARYGLPDMGPDSNPGRNSKWRLRLGLLALVMIFGAGAETLRDGQQKISEIFSKIRAVLPGPLSPALPVKNQVEQALSNKGGLQPGTSSRLSSRVPVKDISSAIPEVASSIKDTQVAGPAMAPPALSAPAEKAYSRLKIKVDIEQTGPVAVSILNSGGVGVKNLYSGPLSAGKYAFTWDGRLDNGQAAPSGQYRIETHSESGVQTQDFWIEKKGKKTE